MVSVVSLLNTTLHSFDKSIIGPLTIKDAIKTILLELQDKYNNIEPETYLDDSDSDRYRNNNRTGT